MPSGAVTAPASSSACQMPATIAAGTPAPSERALSAASGTSAVVVLTGEAGIGKSALLDAAAGRASGFRVIRAEGSEHESALPFSTLHQLLHRDLGAISA